MENLLKLNVLKCANCSSKLARANKFETTIICPYCGTENHVTGTMSEEVAAPERMILFKAAEADFERAIGKFFVDEDYTANDIFERCQMQNVASIYLPMYLYEGTYEANYSCNIGYRETAVGVGYDGKAKEKTVTKWRPASGTAKGNYAFLSLAFDGPELTPELAEWTTTFPYDPISAKQFDVADLKDFSILPHNLDRETTWHKWGTQLIDQTAKNAAYDQLPDGQQIDQFKCSFNYPEKHTGRLFLVPFYFVYYNYNNQKFFAVMDGLGNNFHGNTPFDEARWKEVQKLKTIAKIGLWGGLAIAALLGIMMLGKGGLFIGGLVFLAAWLGTKFFTKSKIKGIIEGARAIRKAAFDRIMG
jgi:hypothetical protein